MKRFFALLTAFLLIFSLAACDKAAEPSAPPEKPAAPAERESEETRLARQLDDVFAGLSLEEKVGQLFFLRCPAENAAETAAQYHLGGILLFTRDYKDADENWLTREQFTDKLNALQAAAKADTGIPLFIGSDEEGGTVTRASRSPNLFPAKFPSPQELYRAGGMAGLLTDTLQYNDSLRALGINVNFAPVCDVTSGEGQFMYDRSFGTDAETTADYISQVVGVMKTAGVGATLKHFPGYGDNVDTHTGIAVDERPYSQFEQADLLPFIAGIEAGAPFVMVNHNVVTCMDDASPASLSPAVHRVLRDALGFDGVILTDDLDMDAVKACADGGSIGVQALAAGNDMLVCSDLAQIAAIVSAVESGTLDGSVVDAACRRVLTVKQDLGLLEE